MNPNNPDNSSVPSDVLEAFGHTDTNGSVPQEVKDAFSTPQKKNSSQTSSQPAQPSSSVSSPTVSASNEFDPKTFMQQSRAAVLKDMQPKQDNIPVQTSPNLIAQKRVAEIQQNSNNSVKAQPITKQGTIKTDDQPFDLTKSIQTDFPNSDPNAILGNKDLLSGYYQQKNNLLQNQIDQMEGSEKKGVMQGAIAKLKDEQKALGQQVYYYNSIHAGLEGDGDPTKTAIILGKSMGDPQAAQQERYIAKGIPLNPVQKANTEQQGLQAMATTLTAKYQNDPQNPDYLSQMANIQQQQSTLYQRNPEALRQIWSDKIGDYIAKHLTPLEINTGVYKKSLPEYIEDMKKEGIDVPDNVVKNISWPDNLPKSLASKFATGLMSTFSNAAGGIERIGGNALGVDKDVLDNDIQQGQANLGKTFNLENPASEEMSGKVLPSSSITAGNVMKGLGGLLSFVGTAGKVGNAAENVLAKVAPEMTDAASTALSQHIGTDATVFASSYEPNYQKATQIIGDDPADEGKRNVSAMLGSLIDAAVFHLPVGKYNEALENGKIGVNNVIKDLPADLKGLSTETLNSNLQKYLQKPLANILESAGNTTEEAGKFGAMQTAGVLLKHISQSVVADNKESSDDWKNVPTEIADEWKTLPISLMPGIFGANLLGGYTSSSYRKQAMYDAFSNPQRTLSDLGKAQDAGLISPAEYKSRADVINTGAKILKETPDENPLTGQPFGYKDAVDWVGNRLQEVALKAKQEGVKDDKVLSKLYDGKIKELQAEREAILKGKPVEQQPESKPVNEEIKPNPVPEEKPTVESAVITINGKTYEGKNHAEAILKAKQAGEDISNVDRAAQGQFKLSDGTVISRDEAKQQFGAVRAEQLIPQDKNSKNADKEYRDMQKTKPTVSDLTGSDVMFNGERGHLKTDEENNVVFSKDGKETILGKTTDTKFNNSDASEHGISEVPKVEVSGDNVKIDNEPFELVSFNKDNDGNLASVSLKREDGKVITKRYKDLALDIAIAKNNHDFESKPEPADYNQTKSVVDSLVKSEHGAKAVDIIDSMPDEVADTFAAMDNKIEALAPEELQHMAIKASEWVDDARQRVNESTSSEKEKADHIKILDRFDKDLNKYYGKLEKQRKSQADASVKREQADSLAAAKQRAKSEREQARQQELDLKEKEDLENLTSGETANRKRLYDAVGEVEPGEDPYAIALKHFASGGKVDNGELAKEVGGAGSSLKNRGKEKVISAEAKKNNLVKAGAEGVEELSEQMANTHNQHHDSKLTNRDFRDAIIDVLESHDSRESAATELVEKYHPEYAQAKQEREMYDHFYAEHLKEVEAEEKWLQDKSNEEAEIKTTPEYIQHLIDQYESETSTSDAANNKPEGEAEGTPATVNKPGNAEPGRRVPGLAEDRATTTERKQQSGEGKQQVKAGDLFRQFADVVEKGKISKLGGFKSSTGFDVVWDSSLSVVAATLRATGKVADAIEAGLQHIKQSDWYKNLKDKKDFDQKYVAHLENEYGKFRQEKSEAEPTAIKNKVVDAEREAEGKSELKSSGDGTMAHAEKTKARIESGDISEEHIRDLTQALANGEKNFKSDLSPTEQQHVLLYDRMSLSKKADVIDSQLIEARDDGNKEAVERLLVKRSQNDLLREQNDLAARNTGREWSDVGRARQLIIKNDYSFEALKRRYKASGEGEIPEAVTEKLRILSKEIENKETSIMQMHEKVAAMNKEISDLKVLNDAAKERQQFEAGKENAFDDLKEETKKQVKAQGRRSIEKIKHDRENIKANLKAKWKNHIHGDKLSANNIIPLDMVPDLVKLAKSYIEEGLAIGKEAVLEKIIDRVHRDVVEALETGVSKTDVRDAITGYGKIKKPNNDPVEKAFRDISAQGRLVSSIELAEKGEPPLKTGQQRDEPTPEQRRLKKELNKAIKDNNIQVVSPEQQLKTSLDAAKTRLKNQIEDLTDAIGKGEQIKKDRKGIEYDDEANALKKQRDELRDEYDNIFGTDKELTDEDKLERAIKAVKKGIDNLQERIDKKDFSKNNPKKVSSTELEDLKTRRKQLRETYNDLMKTEGEWDRRKLAAMKKSLAERTAYLDEIAKSGNIDKYIKDKEKRKKTVLDDEGRNLLAARNAAKKKVDDMIYQREFNNKHPFAKGVYWAGRAMKGTLISNPVILARIIGSVVGRALYKAPGAAFSYGLSKLPFAKGAYTEEIHSGKDLADHLIAYYSTLFSRENFEGMQFAFKHHEAKEDLAFSKKTFKQIAIPDIKVTNVKTAINASFFNTLKLLDRNASLHGALKSMASKPEFEAYRVTIMRNLLREGVSADEFKEPTLMEAVNQLALQKSLRAKFMQDNFVSGAQKRLEDYLRSASVNKPELAEVVTGLLPITKISSNYISEALTKMPVIGMAAAYRPLFKMLASALGKKSTLDMQDRNVLLRTLALQGTGVLSYTLGYMLYNNFQPFFKSKAKNYAEEKNPGAEDNPYLTAFETLSHFPDALAFQAGVSHAWVWNMYDKGHPEEKSMATFMKGMMGNFWDNAKDIASSSPYLSTSSTTISPLLDKKGDFGKAAANFVTSRVPFSTTSSEIAEGKIPILNKFGIKSGNEEKVKPYEVGISPHGFMDNVAMKVPGWRKIVLKKLYDEKYNTQPEEPSDDELEARDKRAEKKYNNKIEFEKQINQ